MSPDTITSSERRHALAVVTIALGIVSLIHGLSLPMLSLVLEREGVGKTLIGLNATAQFLAVFAAAPFVPRLMRNFPPANIMLWSVLASALVFLALRAYLNVHVWFVLRLLLGISLSFLWIAGEAWISHLAEDHARGRTVAIYGAITASGFALGPLALAAVGSEGWTPFILASGIMTIAAIPLALAQKSDSRLGGRASGRFWHYVLMAPVSMCMYFVFSAAEAVLLTFLPIYGIDAGLEERIAIALLTAMAIGGIASQFPVGWMADRLNGMLLAGVGVVLLIGACALLPKSIGYTPWNAVLLLAVGGLMGGFYTLSLVFLGRRFTGADLGPSVTARSIMFCLGAMAGPPVAGAAIELLGPDGIAWTLAALFLLLIPLPVIGYTRRWVA